MKVHVCKCWYCDKKALYSPRILNRGDVLEGFKWMNGDDIQPGEMLYCNECDSPLNCQDMESWHIEDLT